LNPDLAALEAHFGCAIPKELRELYANKEEIQRGDFEVLTKKQMGWRTPGLWHFMSRRIWNRFAMPGRIAKSFLPLRMMVAE